MTWGDRLPVPTAVMAELVRGPATKAQLAAAIKRAPSLVWKHLQYLQRAELVRIAGSVPVSSIKGGRAAYVYALHPKIKLDEKPAPRVIERSGGRVVRA